MRGSAGAARGLAGVGVFGRGLASSAGLCPRALMLQLLQEVGNRPPTHPRALLQGYSKIREGLRTDKIIIPSHLHNEVKGKT